MVRSWVRTHRSSAAALVVGVIALGGVGVYWFAPHKLFLSERVDEAPPALAISSTVGMPSMASGPDAGGADEPTMLASGGFIGLEHHASGRAIVVELADGRRFLRLEDLETSNGPDLRVYLTDQPLSEDWFVWDDGAFVDLGALKGNVGSSNYEIAADLDLSRFRTAVVWCRRFTVGFGVAPLHPEG
jgi:hypothetical protein